MRAVLVSSGACIVAIGWASAALAQQASPSNAPAPSNTSRATETRTDTAASDAAQASPATQLGNIVVTAQRRAENLQRAAVPLDVVLAAGLLKSGISDPTGFGTLVPSLSVSPAGGGKPNIFLRGVSNFAASPLFDSSIAFSYDGVYLGRPGSTTGFFYDLKRIEVLKGSQGTLYGRNATGGAINVIPVHPNAGRISGYATAGDGNNNSVTAEGAINLPLGPHGKIRVSGKLSAGACVRTGSISPRSQLLASIGVDLTGRQNFFVRNVKQSTIHRAEPTSHLRRAWYGQVLA